MSPTATLHELEVPPGGGGGVDDLEPGDGGGGGGGPRYETYQTAVLVLLIPVTMLFVGLTSALVVRRGLSDDWVAIRMPRIFWWNTLLLVASSVTFDLARRAMTAGDQARFRAR